MFPNFGLLWERTLDEDLGALTANMTAWNRWCASVVDRRSGPGASRSRTSRCATTRGCARELADLERAGVHLAMIAPALVDGRPLSHPDHDRDLARVRRARRHARCSTSPISAACSTTCGTPCPTTAVSRRSSRSSSGPRPRSRAPISSSTARSNGIPDLRIGIVELSAVWVPMFLMMLDGGTRVHDPPQRPAGVPAAR